MAITNQLGIRNSNTIIPLTASTKRTKWINVTNPAYITLSGASLSAPLVAYAYIMAYADSAGLWHCRFNMKVSGTSTGARSAATITTSAPYVIPSLTADQVFTVIADTNFVIAAGATAGAALYISHATLDESIYILHGDVVLTGEPTWAAANMEGVVAVDVFVPEATAAVAGIVGTGAQTIAGVKTFNDGIKLDDAAGQTVINYYQEDTTTLATATWGFNTPSGVVAGRITRVGKLVTIMFNAGSDGTSSGSVTNIALSVALPTWARPLYEMKFPVFLLTAAAGTLHVGQLYINPSTGGIVVYYTNSGTAWPNASGSNVVPSAISYIV